jgi:site-specific DNA-methyltransferase (adenine-specific)
MDRIVLGDCLDVMPRLPDACVDAIVTDPPYGLAFMGRAWDHGVPGVPFWAEALRVAKPGAHLAAFGGTRTFHRLACAIEDAGWEIRDCFSWLYGSGFPKSADVSRVIDKAAGAERSVVIGTRGLNSWSKDAATGPAINDGLRQNFDRVNTLLAPATDAAKRWQGWGTALKPAWEPIILARKPLVGTVASNVLTHGTGALNIDGCRIGTGEDKTSGGCAGVSALHEGGITHRTPVDFSKGRWPANVALDEEAAAMLDAQTGTLTSGVPGKRRKPHQTTSMAGTVGMLDRDEVGYADSGGASRFFYTAKASRSERGEGNTHPTVKPVALMRWLCRLVCPPAGSILDPFAGSGTTLLAAHLEGFDYLGVEREAEYVEIIRQRLANVEALRKGST